ncbi:MAG: metalloregulator ArsR/SmtB family transcription factor [Pseudomonadota bacterium]
METNEYQSETLDQEDAAAIFASLGAPVRLSILRALVRAGAPGVSVGVLQQRLAMPGSTLSHHLRALIQAGAIEQERRGRSLICRARYTRLHALAEFLLTECCADDGRASADQVPREVIR